MTTYQIFRADSRQDVFPVSSFDSYIAAFRSWGAGVQRPEFLGLIGTAAWSFPRPGYDAQTNTGMSLVGRLIPAKLDTTVAKEIE
jgi:hypothetical protein